MRRTKAALAAVTLAGVTTAAMLLPGSPAVAFSSGGLVLDLKVQSPAHLIAKGAAVGVPVEYTCFGTNNASLSLSVTERVGGGAIASGSGGLFPLDCTGEIKSATLDISAMSNRAFTKGSAFVDGNIFGCSNFCGQQNDSRTITITQ